MSELVGEPVNNATIKNAPDYRRRRALQQRERYAKDSAYREAKKRRSTEYKRSRGIVWLNQAGRGRKSEWREAIVAYLVERDGPNCGLGGQLVTDNGVRIVDDKSAVIDHVIPVARGGPHRMSNFRLAHNGCNLAANGLLNRKWGP